MDAIDFLQDDALDLPKSWDLYLNSFDDYLRTIFDEYISKLRNIVVNDYISNELNANVDLVENTCADIIEIIRLQFTGLQNQAFQKLTSTLSSINNHFSTLFSSPNISSAISHLYKIRVSGNSTLSRKDIFHIPFELRHLVNTQRYSIPGLPCLYLGGSTYICWEELNRPNLHSIHLARFKPVENSSIKVLDFGYRSAEIAAYYHREYENVQTNNVKSRFIIAQALCWPLIAACSIRVRYRNAPFKQEYILPQLILQWIRETTDIDGIRYFSTKIEKYFGVIDPICNFAFPAKETLPEGYCNHLRSKFELTEPLFWQLAKGTTLPQVPAPNMHFNIEIVQGVDVQYVNTEFGHMQYILANLACAQI